MSTIPVKDRSPALSAAIAVYEATDWPTAPLEQLSQLPVPTGKDAATALKGLPKGFMTVIEVGKYIRAVPVIEGVDASRFVLWLVAVGLPMRRLTLDMVTMMRRGAAERDIDTVLRVLEDIMVRRGAPDVLAFVDRFVVRRTRWGEHDMSVWGAPAMAMLERTGMAWPRNRELYHDWAIWLFEEVHPEPHPRKFYRTRELLLQQPNAVQPGDDVVARLHAAIDAGAPPTEPLGRLPGPLTAKGLLSREDAIDVCLHGLRMAVRPGDVGAWTLALSEDLQLTDSETAAHAEELAAVLSRSVPVFLREFGPWFLTTGPEHLLLEAVMSTLTAKARSTRVTALTHLAQRPAPSNAEELLTLVDDARHADPHRSVQTAANTVRAAWGAAERA